MQFHHLLSLSGYGYLHDLIPINNKQVARIKAITHFNPSSQGKDEVWIDCEVEGFIAHRLQELIRLVRNGDNVMLTFQVEFSAFCSAYAGQAVEDPKHMVTLQGKLQELGSIYINGCLIKPKKALLRAVA